jgi:hypothetical protein
MKNISIVFVQLGNTIPKHLISNIKLVHLMFPQTLINCVVSKETHLSKNIPPYVSIFTYEPSPEVNEIFKLKSIDPKFRSGFWRYSLERLIAIESLHATKKDQAHLHVESDVLLLPNFPLQKFSELKHVSWLPFNPTNDIASLVYFPKYESTQEFKTDLLNYMIDSSKPTDMKGLSNLRHNFPQKYKTLPIFHSLLPRLNTVNVARSNESEVNFGGLFDALNIGMWLTGIDPRNTYGVLELFETKKIVIDNSYIDPSTYSIKYSEKNGLYFESDDDKISIYNLHIHSKSMKIFSKNWSHKIADLTLLSHEKNVRRIFYPKILLSLILDNFKNRTFLEFLYNSPMMSNARQFKIFLNRSSK